MNWSELVFVADDIIDEFGQPITLSSNSYGEYDPNTGLVTNTVATVQSTGVLFDYGEKDINGTTILKGDKKLLIKPSGISSISTNDIVTVNSKDYHIVSVTETNPAGTNLLYELNVRGIS